MRYRQFMIMISVGGAAALLAMPASAQYAEDEILAPSVKFHMDAEGNIRSNAASAVPETPVADDVVEQPPAAAAPASVPAKEEDADEADDTPKHWTEMDKAEDLQKELEDKNIRRSPRESFLMRKKLRELQRAQ